MRPTPALAVVVPFHNEVRYLPKLLQSLAQRPNPHLPVVFVDNASTDGSADVIADRPPVAFLDADCVSPEFLDAVQAQPCTAALADRVRTLFVRHAPAPRRASAPSPLAPRDFPIASAPAQ